LALPDTFLVLKRELVSSLSLFSTTHGTVGNHGLSTAKKDITTVIEQVSQSLLARARQHCLENIPELAASG